MKDFIRQNKDFTTSKINATLTTTYDTLFLD